MKKNVMNILLTVLLSMAVFAQSQKNGLVNDSNVRVRAEPNLNSEILYKVHRGYFVNILEKSEHKEKIGDMEAYWYKIRKLPMGEGWMYGYYLDIGGVEQTDEVFLLDKTETDFVFVEGGNYTLDNLCEPIEVSSFYMQEHEVTMRDWILFTQEALPSFEWSGVRTIVTIDTPDNNTYDFDYDFPINKVRFHEIFLYCNWLSKKRGLEPVYTIIENKEDKHNPFFQWDRSANGYRLPTELEWIYAALGGNKSKGYIYAGSNEADEVAWFYENSDTILIEDLKHSDSEWVNKDPHKVMQKLPNELGLYDMSGSVSEWTLHEPSKYEQEILQRDKPPHTVYSSLGVNNIDDSIIYERVALGGNWLTREEDLSNFNRDDDYEYPRSVEGIRLVRNAE